MISSQFYPSISNCLNPHARCVNQQVRCGGEEFEMHASVVTCGSEYFRAILEHAMAESGLRAFEMHEVQPRVLERVVEWLYSGEVGEISGVAEGLALLEGSRFLGVERLETQCIEWLCAHVDASNCVAVWAEATRLGCGAVSERAMFVVGRRLASVAGEAEFLELSRESLLDLVRSDGLAARTERAVYEAVMAWVRHDAGSRSGSLGEVLSAVRMALLPPAYLARTVIADPLVRESSDALRIVAEANRCSQLKVKERAAAENTGRFRTRKHASGGELVVLGGENDAESSLKSAEMYDGSTGRWRALPDMSVPRRGCAAVCVEENVYVVGGHDGTSYLKSAEMYNGSTGRWRALPAMSKRRVGCAAVCVEGNVYVMGGRDAGSASAVSVEGSIVLMGGYDAGAFLKSVEMFDGSTGQWRDLPDMSVPRQGCAAVCIEGNVYVVGGSSGGSSLKSAEMYDSSTGQWRALPDMTIARQRCAAVSIEGNVYVIGGYGGGSYLRSAEVYDGLMGQWRALPEMSIGREGCAAVSIEGSVYVVGGKVGATKLASVECYNPVTNEWHMLPSMSTARSFCAAAVGEMDHG